MPSWSLFERQEQEYRGKVLPASVSARVAVEAGTSQGWHRYVGSRGRVVTLEHFGASASYIYKYISVKYGNWLQIIQL